MPTLVANQLDPELSQGDVFPEGWDADRAAPLGSVIVLSEGCEIENAPTVLVAPLIRDHQTAEGEGFLGDVKRGRVWRAFHIAELEQPGWVNLRGCRFIDKELLESRLERRECSLSSLGRMALAGRVFAFLTHTLPPAGKYFRASDGVIWDVWEVRPKDVGRLASQFKGKISEKLASGWLYFSCARGARRLAPAPEGWQYFTDQQLSGLAEKADPADPKDAFASAAEQAARPNLV